MFVSSEKTDARLLTMIDTKLMTTNDNILTSVFSLRTSDFLIFYYPLHHPHLMGISFCIDIENSKLVNIVDADFT